jgi:hypothetical protein
VPVTFLASSPGAVVPPTSSTATPGDICPQGWDEDFDRSQMSTQVLIGRTPPTNIPIYWWTFPGATPPTTGQVTLNAPQSEATVMSISEGDIDGLDVSVYLHYISPGSSIRFASVGEPGEAMEYRVTGAIVEHAGYIDVPVVWVSGQTPVSAGWVSLTLTIAPETPLLFVDTLGLSLYGVETMTRTDLISTDRDLFETLADRILEVRGVNSVPRLESVTIDARTGSGIANMELMSTCAPERPSRYRMRLEVDGRPIYDRMCFASAVRHFIARNEWTLRISLDIAEWAGQL